MRERSSEKERGQRWSVVEAGGGGKARDMASSLWLLEGVLMAATRGQPCYGQVMQKTSIRERMLRGRWKTLVSSDFEPPLQASVMVF